MQKTPPRHQANMEVRIAECLESRLCLSSTGWDGIGQGEASLTYYVGEVPADFGLTQAEVEQAVADVLQTWADVINITFTQITTPDQLDSIDIEFGNIDGEGGTLAQAYYPDDVNPAVIAGDILVDISEAWEIGNTLGSAAFDLAYVLTHEVGHALGLEHSDSPDSVMYDTVSPNQEFTGLSEEDIDAALALYAPAEEQTATTDPTDEDDETPSEDPTDTPSEDTPEEDTPEKDTPTDEDPTEDPDDDSDGDDEDLPADDPTDETPTDPGDDEDGSDEDGDDDEEPETPPTEDPRALPRFRTSWGRNFFNPFARPGHGPANTHHSPGSQAASEGTSSRAGNTQFGRQRNR